MHSSLKHLNHSQSYNLNNSGIRADVYLLKQHNNLSLNFKIKNALLHKIKGYKTMIDNNTSFIF